MDAPGLARRNLLQGGVLASGLALVGVRPTTAFAEPAGESGPPFEGMVLAHARLDCRRGASIRITQLDRAARPVRELATAHLSLAELGGGVNRLWDEARRMAVLSAARQWRVPVAQCAMEPGRIVQASTGRSIAYKAWVDVV